MDKTELAFLSLSEQSSLIYKKQISAKELVKTYLERIETYQPRLKAYITVCDKEALASATAIDKMLITAKPFDKPLLGIPIAIKDEFNTRGVLTTNGTLALNDNVPQEDATIVTKLKEAGAILLGKLMMTGGAEVPFGQPRNPWNTDHSPGASSSGSGVAVSFGLCAGSIGEDTGGSIRTPASYCGVVGFRPSTGLVSRYGLIPFAPSLDTASPMGRTVADCAAMLQVIAGYDSKDVLSSRRVVPDYTAGIQRGLKGNRIGVIQELMDDDNLDAEIKAAMVTAIKALIGLGAKVDEVSIPHIKASMYPIGIIIWCEQSALQRKLYESRRHLFTQYARVHHVVGSLLPSKAYVMARQTQNLIRSQVLETFQKYDLLLCPSAPKLPPKIEDASRAAKFPAKDALLLRHADGHLGFAPLAGCPAISVPCGFSQSGLPIGLQITGRPFEEDTVLRVAHAYEQSTDWHNRHPEL